MQDWKVEIQNKLTEAIKQRVIKPIVAEQVREALKGNTEFSMIFSGSRQQYMGIMFVRQGNELLREAIERFKIHDINKLVEYSGMNRKLVQRYIIVTYGIEGWKIFKSQTL